jgi:hypothetical protein
MLGIHLSIHLSIHVGIHASIHVEQLHVSAAYPNTVKAKPKATAANTALLRPKRRNTASKQNQIMYTAAYVQKITSIATPSNITPHRHIYIGQMKQIFTAQHSKHACLLYVQASMLLSYTP